jgi:hypothetical protein
MSFIKLGKKAIKVIDDLVPDKDLARQLKAEIVTLEAQGNWIQRAWRPIGALAFIFVIVVLVLNNYFILPYLGKDAVSIPTMVWSGMFGFISGYGVVRSLLDKR